jgi:hypothetical protein
MAMSSRLNRYCAATAETQIVVMSDAPTHPVSRTLVARNYFTAVAGPNWSATLQEKPDSVVSCLSQEPGRRGEDTGQIL